MVKLPSRLNRQIMRNWLIDHLIDGQMSIMELAKDVRLTRRQIIEWKIEYDVLLEDEQQYIDIWKRYKYFNDNDAQRILPLLKYKFHKNHELERLYVDLGYSKETCASKLNIPIDKVVEHLMKAGIVPRTEEEQKWLVHDRWKAKNITIVIEN